MPLDDRVVVSCLTYGEIIIGNVKGIIFSTIIRCNLNPTMCRYWTGHRPRIVTGRRTTREPRIEGCPIRSSISGDVNIKQGAAICTRWRGKRYKSFLTYVPYFPPIGRGNCDRIRTSGHIGVIVVLLKFGRHTNPPSRIIIRFVPTKSWIHPVSKKMVPMIEVVFMARTKIQRVHCL